jgi:signal transduction histidine kinase
LADRATQDRPRLGIRTLVAPVGAMALLAVAAAWALIAVPSAKTAVIWAGAGLAVIILAATVWLAAQSETTVRRRIEALTGQVAGYEGQLDAADAHVDQITAELQRCQQRIAELTASGDPAQQQAVLEVLGRRQHTLMTRARNLLIELTNQHEDPSVLNGLFALDHLLSRMLRKAENVGLLAGANAPLSQFRDAQSWWPVFAEAIAATPEYKRVTIVQPKEGSFAGHATADIIHLLAELVENATTYSPDDTEVTLLVESVRAGVAIDIIDKGVGIEQEQLKQFNAMLAGSIPLHHYGHGTKGSVGLGVVRRLTERLGPDVHAWLTPNQYGGTTAHVVIPQRLFGTTPQDVERQAPPARPAAGNHGDAVTSSIEPESGRAVVSGTFPAVSLLGRGAHHLRADNELSGERQSDLEQPRWPSDRASVELGPNGPARNDPLQSGPVQSGAVQSGAVQSGAVQDDPAPNEVPVAGDAGPAGSDPTASVPALPPLQRRKPGTTNLPPQLLHPGGSQDPGGFSDEAPNPALAGMFVQARRTQAADFDATDA